MMLGAFCFSKLCTHLQVEAGLHKLQAPFGG